MTIVSRIDFKFVETLPNLNYLSLTRKEMHGKLAIIQTFTSRNQWEEFPILRPGHYSIKTLPNLVLDKKLCPQLSARNMVVYLSLHRGNRYTNLPC